MMREHKAIKHPPGLLKLRSKRGISSTEYSFVLALIAVICITVMSSLGMNVRCSLFSVAGKMEGGFRAAFGTHGPSVFDLDHDGDVDVLDFNLFRSQGCLLAF